MKSATKRGLVLSLAAVDQMVKFSISWLNHDATNALPKRFFRKLLKGLRYSPRTIVTDKLRSLRGSGTERCRVAHRHGGRLNNRAENSHRPTRERERGCNGSRAGDTRSDFVRVSSVFNQFGRVTVGAELPELIRRR